MRQRDARRIAAERAKRLGGTGREVRETVGGKARELGEIAATRAKDVGTRAAPRARELRKTVGEQTRRTRKKVGYAIAGEEPPKRRTALAFAAAGVGAAAAFFLDPHSGKRRRRVAADWLGARIRGAGQRTARLGRGIGARAYGAKQRVVHIGDGDGAGLNDPTLEQKVQSELFQGLDLPSKEINIMVTNGVVSLRGTVPRPELVNQIEARVRRIDGVRDVENQLHLPNTPAPTTP